MEETKNCGPPASSLPEPVKDAVAISGSNGQSRDNQCTDLASLESSRSEKMVVWLTTDVSIQYSDEKPQRDNASRETVSEHVDQDMVHALSAV